MLAAGATVLFHAMLLALLVRSVGELPASPADVASVALILAPAAIQDASMRAIQQTAAQTAPQTETETATEISHRPHVAASIRLRMPAAHVFAVGKPEAVAHTAPAPGRARDLASDVAALEIVIDKAIRGAAVMPPTARRLRREGRVLVRFSYLDGAVDGVSILQSAQFRPLDDAALLAVYRASYPAAPAGLSGRRLNLVVWIDFRMAPS